VSSANRSQYHTERLGIFAEAKAQPLARYQNQFQNRFHRTLPSRSCFHQRESRGLLPPQPLAPKIEGLLGKPFVLTKPLDRKPTAFLLGDALPPILPATRRSLFHGGLLHATTMRSSRPTTKEGFIGRLL